MRRRWRPEEGLADLDHRQRGDVRRIYLPEQDRRAEPAQLGGAGALADRQETKAVVGLLGEARGNEIFGRLTQPLVDRASGGDGVEGLELRAVDDVAQDPIGRTAVTDDR